MELEFPVEKRNSKLNQSCRMEFILEVGNWNSRNDIIKERKKKFRYKLISVPFSMMLVDHNGFKVYMKPGRLTTRHESRLKIISFRYFVVLKNHCPYLIVGVSDQTIWPDGESGTLDTIKSEMFGDFLQGLA